jgi:hypothetical protein
MLKNIKKRGWANVHFGSPCICYLIRDYKTVACEEVDTDDPYVLKGEDQRSGRKNGTAATWQYTYPALISLRSNLGFCGNAPATNHLIRGMARIVPSDSIKSTGSSSLIFT